MAKRTPKAKDASSTEISKVHSLRDRLGKDEMNLVEHPFALLRRGKPGEIVHIQWQQRHPRTGKTIVASWRVDGDSELGLPGPVEERLYLVLMELTREQGWKRQVNFSRHDILSRLSLTKTKANYTILHNAFRRLAGVSIDAERSFWNAEAQTFEASKIFRLLDEVTIVDEPAGVRKNQVPLALSSFKWSDVMFKSLQAGNVRSLNIDFALSLDLPLSARLFRYLDKHRYNSNQELHKFEIELHRLCEIHLGMTKAKYVSKLKERLAPAHEELKQRNFLADVVYESMKSQPGDEKVVYYFTHAPLSALANEATNLTSGRIIEAAPQEVASAPTPMSLFGLEPEKDDEPSEDEINIACDAVFNRLDEGTKHHINKQARETLPPFLQNTLSAPGAKRGIDKARRSIIWNDFRSNVQQELKSRK